MPTAVKPHRRRIRHSLTPIQKRIAWWRNNATCCAEGRHIFRRVGPFSFHSADETLVNDTMPAVVIMDDNYDKLLEQCQTQELEAPGGIATTQVYAQLLALYLLHNDMNNARYLWKRIPQAIKSGNPELTAVWAVGQRIWQRDFPGIYSAIAAYQWSENILPAMDALRETTRRRAYGLVAQAYTSITAEDFAAFVGYSVEEAVKGVVSQGWQADPATRMVMPQKPDPPPVSLVPNEQQLARLTDYVAFLEN